MRRFSLSPRRSTGLLIALALLVSGTALAFDRGAYERGDFWMYRWVASELTKPHYVVGLPKPKICDDYSKGSVCAEFVSSTGSVARMCCVAPESLGTSDPGLCLAGAAFGRDTAPIE